MNARQLNYPDYPDGQEIVVMSKKQVPPGIEWINTQEAAEILDMEVSSISRLCREKKIRCQQHGKNRRSVWEVDKASVLEYRNSDKPVGGRPPKK